MMWDDDNKKIATAILSKRKPNGDRISAAPMKSEVMKTEDGEMDGRHLAAQDMIAAFHEKSPMKLHEAMQSYLTLHNSMPEESGEPDSES